MPEAKPEQAIAAQEHKSQGDLGDDETVAHPLGGAAPTVRSPLRLSETPVEYRLAPPMLGQHNEEVLKGLLGRSDADIASLKAAGVV